MTSIAQGSVSLFFRKKAAIVDHLTAKIFANKNRCVGTEWEMFLIRPEFFSAASSFGVKQNKSFLRTDGQKAFDELHRVFRLNGYQPEYLREKTDSYDKIVGLRIPGLGDIIPEAGYQFEFACSVCNNCEEILEKNEEAYRAIVEAAKRLNLVLVFKGHVPGYAEGTEGMDRSRGEEWRNYYGNNRFDEEALITLREAQEGTASVQVTIDAGGVRFHEFYRALLLLEPALSLYYANSDRSYVGMRAYGELIPSQVEPVIDVWEAKSPQDAVRAIVDRLMEIEVPFLPHPDHPDIYKAEPLTNGRPPTVRDLMNQGRLNEKTLNNVGNFFYTRPAFKNFSSALLEVRGIDSQERPEIVTEIAECVTSIVYDDDVRYRLLADYAHLTKANVQQLHKASTSINRNDALGIKIAGTTVANFMKDIMKRSQNGHTQTTLRRSHG